jgi:hypothetical protein
MRRVKLLKFKPIKWAQSLGAIGQLASVLQANGIAIGTGNLGASPPAVNT